MKTLPKRDIRATKPRYALVHSARLQTASIPSSSSPLCHFLLTSTHWHWVECDKGHWTQLPFLWVCSFPEWNPMERSPGIQESFEVTAWIRSNARQRGKFSPTPKASPSVLCILWDCCCSDSVPSLLLQPPQHLHPFPSVRLLYHGPAWLLSLYWMLPQTPVCPSLFLHMVGQMSPPMLCNPRAMFKQ